jgi:hypothetical protein
MRKQITISAAAVAGVATAGLLAMPVASAFADDDVAMKRDDDSPSVTTVELDDDPDGTDPTVDGAADQVTNEVTNGVTQTGDVTNPPTHDPTNITNGDVTDGVTNGVTNGGATDDASGDD